MIITGRFEWVSATRRTSSDLDLLTHHPPRNTGEHDVAEHLRARLPAKTFHDLYVTGGWSISALALRYQVNRRRITTLATAYGIPLRDPSKPPPGITRRWLTDQYCRRGRSSEDLAAELGLHAVTILDWCRRYDLPVRPAGPRGHRSALYPTEAIPPDLYPVLTGTRPWKRLAAFARLRDHPTLRDTATALALDHRTLGHYVRRLEHELGHRLVNRADAAPYAFTTLTDHGQALATTIVTVLEQMPGLAHHEVTLLPAPHAGNQGRSWTGLSL